MRFLTTSLLCLSATFGATALSASEEEATAPDETGISAPAMLVSDQIEVLLEAPAPSHTGLELSRRWLDNQPSASGGEEWECLSEALYFEARGETVKGQFAVAEVILNRVESGRYPDSVCAVIRQGTGKRYQCQFTYTCDGHKEVIREPRAFSRVGKVARAILDGRAPRLTDGATHYHTTAVRPRWSRVFTKTAQIGTHIFYRQPVQTASAD